MEHLSYLKIYFVVSVVFCFVRSESLIKLPENISIPAIFGFGDSIMDQGNNNNLLISPAKCNYLLYGKDFIAGLKPTGRFTNGKTPLDIIAEELGIKETVPAYLNPENTEADLLTGVSFNSGASGYDTCTSSLMKVIPMSNQLRMFEEYISKLQVIAGEERTSYVLSNNIFLVVAGTVDFATSYYLSGVRKSEYDVPSYADLLVGFASTFLQKLYKLGARKIGVFGMPPLGCVPYMRNFAGGILKNCVEDQNKAALIYNAKLSTMLNSSKSSLPLSNVVYLDIYKPLVDILHDPHRYGLEVVDKSCCSIGLLAAPSFGILCDRVGDVTCLYSYKYMFWDNIHPTENGYRILVDQILPNQVMNFL